MASWQAHALQFLMRLQRRLKRRGDLDILEERRNAYEMARRFRSKTGYISNPVTADGVRVVWLTPENHMPGKVLFYLHGGSFNSGNSASHGDMAVNIAATCRARALFVEYRLAPEHRFPAALEDALAAWQWLLVQGYPGQQALWAGDSAGAGLALSALVMLRERGMPLPQACICLSPLVDLTCQGETWHTNARKDLVVNPLRLRQSIQLYLGGADPGDPRASPLFADLHGLPPLLIQVGDCEILLSDSQRLAGRARQSGVSVQLDVWPGMQHEWQYTASFLPEGRQAIRKIGDYAATLPPSSC